MKPIINETIKTSCGMIYVYNNLDCLELYKR